MQKFRIPGSTPPTNTTTSSQDVSPSYPNHYDNTSQNQAAESKRKPNEMQITRTNNVQSYIDELIETAGTGENLIKNLTPNTALEILQVIHYRITHSDTNGKTEIQDNDLYRREEAYPIDRGKEHISPEPSLQKELLSKYLEGIKQVSNKKKRALLAFYAINNLRFFGDGNGRTARAIYYALLNGSVNSTETIITHQQDKNLHSSHESMDIEFDFQKQEGIMLVNSIRELANILLQRRLVEDGILSSDYSDTEFFVTSNEEMPPIPLGSDNKIMETYHNKPWLSEKNQEEFDTLDDKEKYDIYYALSENSIHTNYSSSLSGLTLAIALSLKGTLGKLAKDYSGSESIERLTFMVNYDRSDPISVAQYKNKAQAIFENWKINDYMTLPKIYNDLKRKQNEIIISIFTDNLCFCDDWNIADWAVGEPSARRHYEQISEMPTSQDKLLSEFLFYNYIPPIEE